MVLLLKATEFAKKGSGAFGAAVMTAAKVAGGLAVGATGLGLAVAGRQTFGAVSKSIQNNAARQRDFKTFGDWKNWSTAKKFNPLAYVGQTGRTITAAVATGVHAIPGTGGKTIGQHMQAQEKSFSEKTHATHILDQKMQQEFGHQYSKDAKYKDLTEREQIIVKKEVDKDELAKLEFGKLFKDLEAPSAASVMSRYDAGERVIENEHTGVKTRSGVVNPTTGVVTLPADNKIMSDVFVQHSKANVAIGEFVQALRKGSYDVRNLPEMSAKTKGFSKVAVGATALAAAGILRLGLKKGGGVEYGTPQRDFFKDIGNTISESLKNAKFNISSGGGGGDHGTKEVKSVGH